MRAKSTIPLFLLAVIWGCYYIATQKAVEHMSVFTVGIVIRFITMILLSVVMVRKKELKDLFKIKGAVKKLLLIGILGFLLDLTAFIGLTLSQAGSGTALLKCDILFVNLITIFIYKQKFTKFEWGYTFVMLFGVLMVMRLNFSNFKLGNKGDIFFILSALFVSINAFVIKSAQKDKRNPIKNNVIAYYNNFITMILFVITASFMGVIGQLKLFGNDSFITKALVLAGIGQTLIYIIYYYNLKRFPVWIVKVFLLFLPIVAAVVSFILFKETMVKQQYIGMVIVILGALGILMEQRKKESSQIENQF